MTVNVTILLKPEIGVTVEDKLALFTQQYRDFIDNSGIFYDYGITLNGTVQDTLGGNVAISVTQPDYVG